MEKKYFEGFEGLKVPYLFFESERGEKFKNNIVINTLQLIINI